MNQQLIEQVAALAELQKQATPGPWRQAAHPVTREGSRVVDMGALAPPKAPFAEVMRDRLVCHGDDAPQVQNAAFIAAAGSFPFADLHAALTTPAAPSSLLCKAVGAGGLLEQLRDCYKILQEEGHESAGRWDGTQDDGGYDGEIYTVADGDGLERVLVAGSREVDDFVLTAQRLAATLAAPSPSVGLLGEGEPSVRSIQQYELEACDLLNEAAGDDYYPLGAYCKAVAALMQKRDEDVQLLWKELQARAAPATPAVGEAGGAGQPGVMLSDEDLRRLRNVLTCLEYTATASVGKEEAARRAQPLHELLHQIREASTSSAATSPLDSQQAGKPGKEVQGE